MSNVKRVKGMILQLQTQFIGMRFLGKNQGPMVWVRKCWNCGAILKKEDPLKVVVCKCGWEWR
ncbi:MAG: hypothetical protein A3G93_15860 [Nitrospinae bacterium RIFCSPLOWO2_12_FULL_45_22]|nr:MAG: hypothetical protein A3G93_15860 [Nitrospinae bacterium RIFCSPLOWO2_12_FULL_45_22]